MIGDTGAGRGKRPLWSFLLILTKMSRLKGTVAALTYLLILALAPCFLCKHGQTWIGINPLLSVTKLVLTSLGTFSFFLGLHGPEPSIYQQGPFYSDRYLFLLKSRNEHQMEERMEVLLLTENISCPIWKQSVTFQLSYVDVHQTAQLNLGKTKWIFM